MGRLLWASLCVMLWALPSFAQEETRSSGKGLTAPMPITGTSIDSDHNALDVYPRGAGPNGESQVSLSTLLACERLQDQASKGHCVIVDATHLTIISTTSAVTIGGGVANDTYLKRIGTTAATAGACVVTGFADSTGAAKSLTFPLGFTGKEFGAARNSAGALTITCSDAGDDDKVYVEWWPAL